MCSKWSVVYKALVLCVCLCVYWSVIIKCISDCESWGNKLENFRQRAFDTMRLPGGLGVKSLLAHAGDVRDVGLIPGLGWSPWRREQQPTPVFLLGESHWQRSLVGYSPGIHKRVGHDWATEQWQRLIFTRASLVLALTSPSERFMPLTVGR